MNAKQFLMAALPLLGACNEAPESETPPMFPKFHESGYKRMDVLSSDIEGGRAEALSQVSQQVEAELRQAMTTTYGNCEATLYLTQIGNYGDGYTKIMAGGEGGVLIIEEHPDAFGCTSDPCGNKHVLTRGGYYGNLALDTNVAVNVGEFAVEGVCLSTKQVASCRSVGPLSAKWEPNVDLSRINDLGKWHSPEQMEE